ncbi:hypothetical protein [Kocuria tytonis]|uniref:Ead/Ea22-like family protein n=1 Tax=Kocuria tytonis TaxID=2054280 RepID=A0A495A8F8_9MICC|nr:hypothetical protein [Kocuria tytonis]RKQ36218.1 hypothetical protein C1C97_000585 [Kocuria tytonis]
MTTNEPMTREQFDAIRERVDATTEGPWTRWAGLDDRDNSVASDGREDAPTVADVIPEKDDAAFIAHAREDVPALLAEVERRGARLTVDDDMVERAKRAFGAATAQVSSIPLGMSEAMFIDSVGLQHQHAIRAALNAALGIGEDA